MERMVNHNQMTLTKHYKIAALYPALIVILLTTVFSIIDNYNYKSEWFSAESMTAMCIETAIIYCFIICLLSLTIFLIQFEKIRSNIFFTAVSWFLLPMVFIGIVFTHEINFRIKYEEKFGNDFIYILILNIPFVIGLCWSYWKYRKHLHQ